MMKCVHVETDIQAINEFELLCFYLLRKDQINLLKAIVCVSNEQFSFHSSKHLKVQNYFGHTGLFLKKKELEI